MSLNDKTKLILLIHDTNFSTQEVIINPEYLQVQDGCFIEITIQQDTSSTTINLQVFKSDQDIQKLFKTHISISQSVASAFNISSRCEIQVRIIHQNEISCDFIELNFKDQYIGRADMKRLQSDIQGTCLYVGKKLVTLGVRAQVKELIRNGKYVTSGFITNNTKMIYRSESAKYFLFIQMSSEMWEFDEDGELNLEKCLGFLAELFQKWKAIGNNHVVSIILFSRIYHDHDQDDEDRELSMNESKSIEKSDEHSNFKDYYKVIVDKESRSDWADSLISISNAALEFRKEVLCQNTLSGSMVISGKLSSASHGNILEAVNLALNPFDKHYIDRDLMRTGLSIVIITPGSGLFNVDKKLCRLTTQRMIDNGIGLDLVSVSRPPLHTVPLFKFVSGSWSDIRHSYYDKVQELQSEFELYQAKIQMERIVQSCDVWDPLYFDEQCKSEDIFYTIPQWIDMSYWRGKDVGVSDDFFPRCKMYEVQQMGIMEQVGDHIGVENMTNANGDGERNDSNTSPIPNYQLYDNNAFTFVKFNDLRQEENVNYQNSTSIKKPSHHTHSGSSPTSFSNIDTWKSIDYSGRNATYPKLDDVFKEGIKEISKHSIDLKYLRDGLDIRFSSHHAPLTSNSISNNGITTSNKYSPINIQKNVSFGTQSPRSKGVDIFKATRVSNSYSGSSFDFSKHPVRISPPRGKALSQFSSIKQNYINPCNPIKNFVRFTSQIRRWHHLFPKVIHPESNELWVNWKSLLTPACLPLTTDFFPSNQELMEFYEEFMYTVQPSDDAFINQSSSRSPVQHLLEELISQRIAQGFQIIDESKSDISNHASKDSNNFGSSMSSVESKHQHKSILLGLGDHFHKLTIDEVLSHVEVKRYVRRIHYDSSSIQYKGFIWTQGMVFYEPKAISFQYPLLGDYNWNYLDHLLSGYQDDMTDTLKVWQTRFLLVPMDIIPSTSVSPVVSDNFDEEELRLYFFRKFIEVFEKARCNSNTQEVKPIQITYTTSNASIYVKEEIPKNTDITARKPSTNMPLEMHTKSMNTKDFLIAMQGICGVEFKDRRWHFKMYECVFLGDECVDWMVNFFTDITTRDQAITFGNELLKDQVFEHVLNKHQFLDGHYFYRLKSDTGGVILSKSNSDPIQQEDDDVNCEDSIAQNAVILSKAVIIDLDPSRKSCRKEIAFLHYDTIHNPRNCYHFQIHWLACTARLIEDSLSQWTRLAERCGLKLVEAPIEQMPTFSARNPFQSVHKIQICNPSDAVSVKLLKKEILFKKVQGEILYLSDYILDVEADTSVGLNVEYSYTKTEFKYTQYVHKSGAAFVQLIDDSFLWIVNQLYTASLSMSLHQRVGSMISTDKLRSDLESCCSNSLFVTQIYEKLLYKSNEIPY